MFLARGCRGMFVGYCAVLFALSSSVVSGRVFNACQVVDQILAWKIDIAGESQPADCNPSDIPRIVCSASLHNYNTSYEESLPGNRTAVGIFGLPSEYVTSCKNGGKSDYFTDSLVCLSTAQFALRNKNLTLISEMLCKDFDTTLQDYFEILRSWNMSDSGPKWEHLWKKEIVKCKSSNKIVYESTEKFRRFYTPGVLLDDNIHIRDVLSFNDSFTETCREQSYCMRSCSDKNQSYSSLPKRSHKGRMERKIEKLARIVDWAIIVIWILAVGGGAAVAYFFFINPRRRRPRQDDWERPILTAHFNQ